LICIFEYVLMMMSLFLIDETDSSSSKHIQKCKICVRRRVMKALEIASFARVIGHPLYWYQEKIGEAILASVRQKRGGTISVMLARQMGKNQLSAILEAYLLACVSEGTIVKAAPTYKPQVITSRMRLLSMLDNPMTRSRTWRSHGYIVGVAPNSAQRASQSGPRIMFFSASPDSNIVGATASLLLEVDEAQDVAGDKFDRDLRPMASTTNSTTILYGTAWSDDTLLAMTRANNLALEQQDGIKRHFEYDWRTLAAINHNYKQFVTSEIQRLGADHPAIQTQYFLQPISGAGHLLSSMQQHLLQGDHAWEAEPDEEGDIYIASMDVGGEQRPIQGSELPSREHDSTVITIGKLAYNDLQLPTILIVHQYCWTGKNHVEQYAQTVSVCERWKIRKLVIDKTGLGEMLASLLITRLGDERVQAFHFTRSSKSALTYQFLGLINSGRLKLYRPDTAPYDICHTCWQQLKLARYHVPAPDVIDMYVNPAEGHDDFLISLALCGEAARDVNSPAAPAYIIKPRRFYTDGVY
jgi:hypothetical protein